MIFSEQGRIGKDLYLLGPPGAPVFLILGESVTLVDAGFASLGPLYVRNMEEILGNREPDRLLLTHVHFDHCGAAAFFQSRFPRLTICCSREGQRILGKPRALELIHGLNRAAGQMMRDMGLTEEEAEFIPFEVDRIVEDGEVLPISRSSGIEVLSTPGHTRDSLSFYLPEQGALLCGEAAGVPSAMDYIFTEASSDFDAYMRSLTRLSQLPLELVCPAHNYVYTGGDARQYMHRSLEWAGKFKDWVLECMKEERNDTQRVMERIKSWEYDPLPGPKQPESAYMLNLEAKIKAVMESSQNREEQD